MFAGFRHFISLKCIHICNKDDICNTYTFNVPKYPFIPFRSNEQQQKNVDLKLKSQNYISTLNTNMIPVKIVQELT